MGRDEKRKERNQAVRNLVSYVRKRDKRVAEHSKKLQEKAEENKRKTAEFQKKQREERKKLFEVSYQNAFNMNDMEAQLKQLEGQYSDSDEEYDEDSEACDDEDDVDTMEEEAEMGHEDSELDDLFCVACDKLFRTVGAKENHETSRKHKDNMDKLIKEMQEEEASSNVIHLMVTVRVKQKFLSQR